jgi:hypothetical protein
LQINTKPASHTFSLEWAGQRIATTDPVFWTETRSRYGVTSVLLLGSQAHFTGPILISFAVSNIKWGSQYLFPVEIGQGTANRHKGGALLMWDSLPSSSRLPCSMDETFSINTISFLYYSYFPTDTSSIRLQIIVLFEWIYMV